MASNLPTGREGGDGAEMVRSPRTELIAVRLEAQLAMALVLDTDL